jgi:hypothetical protein
MYDDHSNDKNSYDNILKLKDNIQYRLFAASHQYLVFLRELTTGERYLKDLYQKKPGELTNYLFTNPHFDQLEVELSSLFDNIIFQLASMFDYISHIICYISFKNKSNTVYWTKLRKFARGKNNDLKDEELKSVIDKVDRRFVGRLYDYRSRLIHHHRDKHEFSGAGHISLEKEMELTIQLQPSTFSQRYFALINEETNGKSFTLTYLASWLIKRTLFEIEEILNALEGHLKKESYFHQNVGHPKNDKKLNIVSIVKETNTIEPASEGLWRQYKAKKV